MNDVNDRAGSNRLKILNKSASVAAIRVRRVDALGGEVVETLEVGVHDNLLLVCVLERFATRNGPLHASRDRRAPLQSTDITTQNIHKHRLGNVVRIVTGDEFIDAEQHATAIERLASKNAAKCAIVLTAHLFDDLVHSPPVQLFVGDHLERKVVAELIALDTLERVVTVAGDAFVNREQDQLDAIVVTFVELLEHIGEHGRVLAATGADADALASLEELRLADCLVDFFFEYEEEALSAHGVAGFRPLEHSPIGLASLAFGCHCDFSIDLFCCALI